MQLLKQFQPLFLSFTVIACCLTFQADTVSTSKHNTYVTWITSGSALTKTQDIYKIKPRKAESVLGNNFSIFSFKCFIKQHKGMFATHYKQRKIVSFPEIADYLTRTIQTSKTEDDSLLG